MSKIYTARLFEQTFLFSSFLKRSRKMKTAIEFYYRELPMFNKEVKDITFNEKDDGMNFTVMYSDGTMSQRFVSYNRVELNKVKLCT